MAKNPKDNIKLIGAIAVLAIALALIAYNVLGSGGRPAPSTTKTEVTSEPTVDNAGVMPGKEVPATPPRGQGAGKRQMGGK